MRKYSKKRAKQNREYEKIRDEYLLFFSICEVCDDAAATEIHHMKGRIGELLTNSDFFLAVCRSCHIGLEQNPVWAKEKGYSLNRL